MRIILQCEGNSAGIPAAYQKFNISIHAVATFKELESYLRPKIAGSFGTASNASNAVLVESPSSVLEDTEKVSSSQQVGETDDSETSGVITRSMKKGLEKERLAKKGNFIF